MPKKGGYGKFKTYKRKLKSSFIISADSESILAPEGNRKKKSRRVSYKQISKIY